MRITIENHYYVDIIYILLYFLFIFWKQLLFLYFQLNFYYLFSFLLVPHTTQVCIITEILVSNISVILRKVDWSKCCSLNSTAPKIVLSMHCFFSYCYVGLNYFFFLV